MFSFDPLWKSLIDKKMTREELRIKIGAGRGTMAKMSKGEYVAMDVLDRICKELGIKIEEVIKYVDG